MYGAMILKKKESDPTFEKGLMICRKFLFE
jgi:hypothetical protein